MAAVILVLLIACSNVASLVLAHASGRTLEMTVRTALGASRMRLIRQVLAESLCLAGIGGVFGVLTAYFAVRVLKHINSGNIPRIEEVSVDLRVLLFTLCVSLASGIAFGLFPALSASGCNLNEGLKSSGKRIPKGSSGLLHRGLMVSEVALTVVLLAGSGLLIHSFVRLQSVDKGFSPESTVTMNVQLDERYNSRERQNQFYRTLVDRTNNVSGVQAAGAITHLPLSGSESISLLTVEGHPFDNKTFFEERSVSPRYFAAMGIPLLQGRGFTEADNAGGPRVAIVSRSFAARYFSGSAIGHHFGHYDEANGTNSSSLWTIVGVVADVRQMNLDTTPPMEIYTPLWGAGVNSISVVARTNIAADQLAADMRAVVRDLDPTIAVADVRTMNELVSEATAERRFQTVLLTSFGGFALFLSLIGLYAMLAYSVRQRTAEIGIRLALGAQRSSIMRMVLTEGSKLAFVGLTMGIGCAWILTRSMSALLFEVKPLDPTTFFGVPVLFCAVALAACYLPARRATRVDPMVALRYE
jgi:putative ABC transport system permease protein